MLVRSRWSQAALALLVAAVLFAPPPAGATELQYTEDGLITLPGSGSSPSGPPPPSSPTSRPEAARLLLNLANQERARVGAPTLVSRADVVDMAMAHTRKMLEGDGGIFHNLDLLESPLRNLLGALAVGENVGRGTHVEDLHPAFMASAGHRAPILDPRFTVAGFAVIQDTDGQYYVTQDFVQPSGGAPAAPPVAAPVTQASAPAPSNGPPQSPSAPRLAAPRLGTESIAAPALNSAVVIPATNHVEAALPAQPGEHPTGFAGGLVTAPAVAAGASTASSGGPVGIALSLVVAILLGQLGWWRRRRPGV